jgi:AcrR family transcriptional regulator
VPSERRPSKRQQQAAATREQLLVAAREVFEEKGYQAATVGAITERADTAHGTFYLYFGNKEDVFCSVIQETCDELYREASAPWAKEPLEGIRAGTTGFLRTFGAHAGLWRALLEGMLQSPRIEAVWLDLRRKFVDRLTHILERQRASGTIRDLDPQLAAGALGAMTEWFAFTNLVLHEPAGGVSVDELAAAITDLWFHAVYGTVEPASP